MSQAFERARSRLNKIHAIEPLLGALRTLSMGTWQSALKRIALVQQNQENYDRILVEILPKIKERNLRTRKISTTEVEIADTILLFIGSERGLCGKFNKTLIKNSLDWIEKQNFASYQVWAMGSRMIRELENSGVHVSWRKPLPASELASYQQSYLITQNWLEQFETYAFNRFILLFNQTAKGGGYQFSIFTLLPYEIHHPISVIDERQDNWTPPIIETDPRGIYHQVIEHYIAVNFYSILLKSAAAEHAFRYNLLLEAEDNAEDIMKDLQQILNKERKRKITQEIQELASGAGLLDN
jgi:F-type H+-transporting ATPase subunit gamma